MQEVSLLLGNDENASDTDFFPIAAGIVWVSWWAIADLSFTVYLLGLRRSAGNALVLSKLGKTGPIIFMSSTSNQLLRQLGLLLLGRSGHLCRANLFATFQTYGLTLFLGRSHHYNDTLIVAGTRSLRFKIPILTSGYTCGGMTSTPGLATIDSMTDSNRPSVVYATIHPVGMVMVIVLIQVIALLA